MKICLFFQYMENYIQVFRRILAVFIPSFEYFASNKPSITNVCIHGEQTRLVSDREKVICTSKATVSHHEYKHEIKHEIIC